MLICRANLSDIKQPIAVGIWQLVSSRTFVDGSLNMHRDVAKMCQWPARFLVSSKLIWTYIKYTGRACIGPTSLTPVKYTWIKLGKAECRRGMRAEYFQFASPWRLVGRSEYPWRSRWDPVAHVIWIGFPLKHHINTLWVWYVQEIDHGRVNKT